MTTFKKYEFTDQAEWSKFQAKIQVKSTDEEGVDVYSYKDVAVVELGHICKAYEVNEEGFEVCTDLATTWAVDILWFRTLLPSFKPFEVYPNPCGIHTFAGWAETYTAEFCSIYPDSPYCIIPDEDISE
jgi:hypothetical protein